MPTRFDSYHSQGVTKKSSQVKVALPKRGSQQRCVERHELALTHRQAKTRREVPLADERTLNLVFNE